jgi:hypothetical protein
MRHIDILSLLGMEPHAPHGTFYTRYLVLPVENGIPVGRVLHILLLSAPAPQVRPSPAAAHSPSPYMSLSRAALLASATSLA